MSTLVKHIKTIVTIMLTIVFFSGCKNDISVVNQLFKDQTAPDEISKNLHLYISQGGKVTHEFKTPLLHTYRTPTKSYQECPEGVEVITYDESQQKISKLSALYGINHEDDKIMEAKNNVVITNFQTGEIIETEHLIWDVEKKMIYSNTQIKQTKSDGSIYMGKKFESDESLSKYTIYNPQLMFYEDE
ncbi:MAG: LPS export ABC transporter periplasmic protein LptC [Bacteroidales bacterium]|nr:LPS export ABC transporter periplasmic protein LptC [Bacteroidales bacterium]